MTIDLRSADIAQLGDVLEVDHTLFSNLLQCLGFGEADLRILRFLTELRGFKLRPRFTDEPLGYANVDDVDEEGDGSEDGEDQGKQ